MTYDETARKEHRSGYSCSAAVYNTFADINPNSTSAPVPRSEGGKCGAVLAAEKVLSEMGVKNDFEQRFLEKYGSVKCAALRMKRIPCNDLVGTAAAFVDE